MTDEARCTVPPEGWECSREPGHDGPCAATKKRPTVHEHKGEPMTVDPDPGTEFLRMAAQERLAAGATGLIYHLMECKGITPSELARLLGKRERFVAQVLSHKHDMTLRTFADILFVLDQRAELVVTPREKERKGEKERKEEPGA